MSTQEGLKFSEVSASPYLYYRPEYLKTQFRETIYVFILSRGELSAGIAKFQCSPGDDQIWYSPPQAPFGGVIIENSCTKTELEFFLNCIKEWFKTSFATKLIVKTAPACYDPDLHRILHQCYINTGFRPIRTLVNHYVSVNNRDFANLIHVSEQRRLRKSGAAGFQTSLNKAISSEDVVTFLKQCQDKNGYRLSLSEIQLQTLLNQFPDDFLVFSAIDREKLIATAVTVRVNHKILYYFLSAFLPEYRKFSPMVLLIESIHKFCQQNHITLFDLGTSFDHRGDYKPSLAKFKENIGGDECIKIIYELNP